jgi:hypothetical protein
LWLGKIPQTLEQHKPSFPRTPFLDNFRAADNPGVSPSMTTSAFTGTHPVELAAGFLNEPSLSVGSVVAD